MFSRVRSGNSILKYFNRINSTLLKTRLCSSSSSSSKTYTDSDEWLYQTNNDNYKIGLSNKASELLGELVYIEYNFEVGEEFNIDEDLVFIESVKAANSIKAPFNGTIVKNNTDIENEGLHFINEDPECINVSWFCELEKKND